MAFYRSCFIYLTFAYRNNQSLIIVPDRATDRMTIKMLLGLNWLTKFTIHLGQTYNVIISYQNVKIENLRLGITASSNRAQTLWNRIFPSFLQPRERIAWFKTHNDFFFLLTDANLYNFWLFTKLRQWWLRKRLKSTSHELLFRLWCNRLILN